MSLSSIEIRRDGGMIGIKRRARLRFAASVFPERL
jgi:hypothetical protein